MAVRAPGLGGDALITHAGITRGFWEDVGRPESAVDAAAVIDRLAVAEPDVVFRAGWMLVWRWRSAKPASWSMPPVVCLDRERRHA